VREGTLRPDDMRGQRVSKPCSDCFPVQFKTPEPQYSSQSSGQYSGQYSGQTSGQRSSRNRLILRQLALTASLPLFGLGHSATAIAQEAQVAQGSGLMTAVDAITHEEFAALSIILSVLLFAALAAVLYLQTRDKLAAERAARTTESRVLKERAERAERFLATDRQILIAWPSDGGSPEIETGTFAVIDTPQNPEDLLNFESWIDSEGVAQLDAAIHELRRNGTVFDMTVGTCGGATIEATGLISGRHAILRLREATNLRHELRHLRIAAADSTRDATALKAAADRATFPVWVRDGEGALVWVNQAFAEEAGFTTPETAISERAEITEDAMVRAMEAARDQRQPFSDVSQPEGREPLQVREIPIRNGYAGLAIPSAVAVSGGSARSNGFRNALDHVQTGIAQFDRRGRLCFFNETFCALWDWDREWLDTGPDEKGVLDRMRSQSQLPQFSDYREWREDLVDDEGQTVKVHDWHLPNNRMLNVITVPQADGSRTYLFDNLTESRELETRVVALNQIQRETLESLTEGIVVFGSNGRIRLSNPQFREMWALDASDAGPGVHIDALVLRCQMKGGDREDWAQLKDNVTGYSETRRGVSSIMTLSENEIFQTTCVPLPDGGTLAVFTDISDTQRIERALRERNDALEQANRIRNSFVGKVSYELRQPLQNIIGFAQVLSEPALAGGPEQQQEYAGHILSESSELLVIVNSILDLASIDAGTFELEPRSIPLRPAIDDAVATLGDRLRKRDVDVQIDTPEDLTDVIADPERLRQILFNLLANAVSFSPAGAIVRVRAGLENDILTLSVSDRGPGIPTEVLERVFDRFESQSGGTDHRGVGLGLSLVKSFVDLHQGQVWIESSKDTGTKVTCRFPQNDAALPPLPTPHSTGDGVDAVAGTIKPTT
jgi:signal transduction histidine kinase